MQLERIEDGFQIDADALGTRAQGRRLGSRATVFGSLFSMQASGAFLLRSKP